FLISSLICFFAQDINTLLIGRFIQGLGVAGPYVSAISIVRDKYTGNEMARIMSLVMLIFIMVPALAPSLGQAVLLVSSWRYIFVLYIAAAVIGATSSIMSMVIGTIIGQLYNGTLMPITCGFLILSTISLF